MVRKQLLGDAGVSTKHKLRRRVPGTVVPGGQEKLQVPKVANDPRPLSKFSKNATSPPWRSATPFCQGDSASIWCCNTESSSRPLSKAAVYSGPESEITISGLPKGRIHAWQKANQASSKIGVPPRRSEPSISRMGTVTW